MKKENKKWTLAKCKKEAKKYSSKSKWVKTNGNSFNVAKKNGWLNECVSNMDKLVKPRGYWTLEKCIEEAKKYTTKKEWSEKSRASYVSASYKGWIGKCTDHMIIMKKPAGYWTEERCLEEAKKYTTLKEWFLKSRGSYNANLRHQLLGRIIKANNWSINKNNNKKNK